MTDEGTVGQEKKAINSNTKIKFEIGSYTIKLWNFMVIKRRTHQYPKQRNGMATIPKTHHRKSCQKVDPKV